MVRLFYLISFIFLTLQLTFSASLKIDDKRFTLDGQVIDLWGIRVASAIKSTTTTNHLINQLDQYKKHKVNTVAVYFQGSSGGSYDPFSKDGKSIDPKYLNRMKQIIEECNKRKMIVLVGIFYQMQRGGGEPTLNNWNACKNAIAAVTKWLQEKDYQNIILNIANEQNSNGHKGKPWENVRHVPDLLEMVRLVKTIDPNCIAGCGGYDHEKNIQFGLSPDVDVLLFDTLGPNQQKHSGKLYDRFVKAGIDNKPMINVEMFGGWTKKFMPIGVYGEEGKAEHFQEIEDAAKRPGLSVFFHSNPWCQGPSVGGPVRYNLGGQGTKNDPGIHWYFDRVLDVAKKHQENFQ